ncbi:hypothetical protein [Pseudomonas putida]|uniref:hypothetical protein n=1 Tax=Pseudomonas putida TaxID=303 RepID=UPI0015E1B4F8|nr:hypothetical protein [Pseudomonas putida]
MCQSFVPLLQLSIEHFEDAAAPGSTIMKISGQRMMLEAINGFLSRKLLIVLVVGLGCGFHGHPATYSINIRPLIPR